MNKTLNIILSLCIALAASFLGNASYAEDTQDISTENKQQENVETLSYEELENLNSQSFDTDTIYTQSEEN